MKNKYVSYMSDKVFMEHVAFIVEGYFRAYGNKTSKDLFKNQLDATQLRLDFELLNLTAYEVIQREIIRQAERATANLRGEFQERLMGSLPGLYQLPKGQGIDVMSKDQKIAIEVKNKHNTVKGSDLIDIFKTLRDLIDDPNSPVEEGYFVRIEDKKSQLKPWVFTHKGEVYEHENIFIASADQFYSKMTGSSTAFAELDYALAIAIKDYTKKAGLDLSSLQPTPDTILKGEYTNLTDEEAIQKLIDESHSHYEGYNQKTI